MILVSDPIKKLAAVVVKIEPCLDKQDVSILKNDGPGYLRHVQTNVKLDKKPLAELGDTAKRVLLAYVIFLRQNMTMGPGDHPNQEDTAKILHGEILNEGKEKKKELEEELLKQLSKIGIEVDK
jgi:hypothetical protein